MEVRRVVVRNDHGLHARPAALFVQKAGSFACRIQLAKEGKAAVDAKSILSVMGLGVENGETVTLVADGEGAKDALDALELLLTTPSTQG